MKIFGVGQEEQIEENEIEIEHEEELPEETGQLALDILETQENIIILSPIAGIDLSEIDVSYNNGVLIIKGNRKKPDLFEGHIEVRNSECYWGVFSRNIILPENLDFNSIDASMEHNLLMITIRKLEFEPQSNIKINRTSY
ncbi:MAG: Hsp20/alpha crystallin family protein [Candidatus Gracilibacteria bacterium]|nr:Hsp20/alpha crystallin family protein [Candidatus Gracilibacteria bacterium]